jgi:glycosyltransferase involved in cell wall biosynthesis
MKIAVVMPAWNEAEGISGFIEELNVALSEWEPVFVVVDDCSTDDTSEKVRSLTSSNISVALHTNPKNSGHGPSTITALQLGLATGAAGVVSIDGDGQFLGDDVAHIVEILMRQGVDVVEGVRTQRDDPRYRRVVSLITRLLVASKARAIPKDANTPLRAYKSTTLASILTVVPERASTPNLIISVICRRWSLSLTEVPVKSISRRGSNPDGSTWGKAHKSVPSKRFLSFCAGAVGEWLTTPVKNQAKDVSK